MQTNVLWTGIEYYSLENCLININNNGSEINSVIIGQYENKIYRVEYKIKTNQNWEISHLEIHSQNNNRIEHLKLESDGKGNWMMDGKQAPQFRDCTEVDIALSPFTNTLPINRLNLAINEERQIQVVYVDLLEYQIIPVKQKYTRLSNSKYQYENVPNDFEATIEVDELGLVVDYPSLFRRTGRINSSYSHG